MLEFGRRFDEHYRCYQLSVGYLHHFDTTKIHTLFNDGDTERVSLLVDVKAMIGLPIYSNFQESIVLFIIMKTKSLFDHHFT